MLLVFLFGTIVFRVVLAKSDPTWHCCFCLRQDDEYLASLQADQEKELRAKAEAEARQLEEAAARQAALEEERRKEEECRRKMEEEQVGFCSCV